MGSPADGPPSQPAAVGSRAAPDGNSGRAVRKGTAASPARSRSGRRKGKDGGGETTIQKEAPHFDWVKGQYLGADKRYVVRKLLGEGTFGRVLCCVDTQKKQLVAVKIVRGLKRYCEHAEAEAEVLREIVRCDPGRQSHCVQLQDAFIHPRYHFCMVFERLDVSVRDFLRHNDNRGLLMADIRSVARQLMQCLTFLHALGLTHTDIKCRNVMFRDSRYDKVPLPRCKGAETHKLRNSEIVVIDFGGALFAAERHDARVGTKHYRSPEVVLGLKWNEKTDLWSVGCLLAMLYMGERPFSMNEDMEHLALIQKFVGQELPRQMVREANAQKRLTQGVVFDSRGRLEWPSCAPDEDSVARVDRLSPLREVVRPQHGTFLELLEGLLQLDPKRRLSADAASDLPFVASEAEVPE